MKAVSSKQTRNYVIEDERGLPKEEQTVFVTSYLSAEQSSFIDDNIGYQGENGYQVTLGKTNLIALHLGLKEIENFFDESGKEIKIVRDKSKRKMAGGIYPIKMDVINRIPKDARDEVAGFIRSGVELEEKEVKNS